MDFYMIDKPFNEMIRVNCEGAPAETIWIAIPEPIRKAYHRDDFGNFKPLRKLEYTLRSRVGPHIYMYQFVGVTP